MNKIKLMSILQDYFNADDKQKRKQVADIQEVIKKLKEKQRKTEKMLNSCTDDAMRKALQMEVDIMSAQIEKGNEVLHSLNTTAPKKNG